MQSELNGFYGSGSTPCTIYYYDGWYAVEGSVNVNRTQEDLFDGVNVETLSDFDMFTASKAIDSLEDLINEVDS